MPFGFDWYPLILTVAMLLLILRLIWVPYTKEKRRRIVSFATASIVLLSIILSGTYFYHESFVSISEDIYPFYYMPFGDVYGVQPEDPPIGTQVKKLDEPSTLAFQDNPPRLVGKEALYPLYSSFARATYPVGHYRPDTEESPVACDTRPILNSGYADVAFVASLDLDYQNYLGSNGYELNKTPICREAFVFIVNSKNNITNLSLSDIRKIYTGQITNWKEVGGKNEKIDAYQRSEIKYTQPKFQSIIGETPLIEAKKMFDISWVGDPYLRTADYANHQNAIGYSYRFFTEFFLSSKERQDIRLLSIDGVAPTPESIASGEYPLSDFIYAVTIANMDPVDDEHRARLANSQRLIDWILSDQGQELVEKTGYVKLNQ
ncbi:MAG: substrate-binding domain-containing protein [Clostridiales bacterium]|jgi:phosphate transport system substrate-binding protein|nr:substrate-binding domain-containing protein [Clostridiales bacterium]